MYKPRDTRIKVVAMRVRIDADKCQGHMRCMSYAPRVFYADDQGNAYTEVGVVSADDAEDVKRAVISCPESAIDVYYDSPG